MKNEITAKRIALALEANNMKAQELADRSGVSKVSISQYINGTHAPSNVSAGKMASVLGVSPVWLMGFDVPMLDRAQSDPYYLDPDAARAAQQAFDDPDLRALFDAARDSKADDIRMATDMLKRFKETNPDG